MAAYTFLGSSAQAIETLRYQEIVQITGKIVMEYSRFDNGLEETKRVVAVIELDQPANVLNETPDDRFESHYNVTRMEIVNYDRDFKDTFLPIVTRAFKSGEKVRIEGNLMSRIFTPQHTRVLIWPKKIEPVSDR